MHLEGERWRQFFDSYQHDAWRLETLPAYGVASEDEEFAHFQATGELYIPDDDPWLIRIRNFRATGRTIGRVHLVTRPLTDYLRYEFAVYAFTSGAGEDVRILDLTARTNPGLPEHDFWLLDDNVVAMHYARDGRQTGRELLDSPDLDRYREWKRLAIEHSVPFREYPHR